MTNTTANEAIIDWLGDRDHITGAINMIDVVHHEVHEGEMFTTEYTRTGVADTGTVQYVMTTGAKQPHLAFTVNAGGACQVWMYEGSTATGGTALPIYNNNRLSSRTPVSSWVHSPSAGTVGTVALVSGRFIPGGASVQTRIGGAVRSNVEWMLRTSTKYTINVVNVSGGAVTVTSVFEWYEEDPG
jgi:hypothetical protein